MPVTASVPPPDLSSRPLQAQVECQLAAAPKTVFEAWTLYLDRWLAAPGTVLMQPQVNTAFYFETHHGGSRQPYFGRILQLEPDRLIQFTWLSTGTQGLESVITLDLKAEGTGTRVLLTHAGFCEEAYRDAHQEVWPTFLQNLDRSFPRTSP